MKVLLVFLSLSLSAHAENCAPELASPGDATHGYLAYLDALLQQRILSPDDVAALVSAPLTNPLGQARGSQNLFHARELDFYLRSESLHPEAIARWASERAEASASTQERRAPVTAVTGRVGPAGLMNFVKGGSFKWYRRLKNSARADESIENIQVQDFEIMPTSFTREMWTAEMGGATWHSPEDLQRPITGVNFPSVAVLANKLSRAAGLEPFYDLDDVPWGSGRAEDGNLEIVNDIIHETNSNGYRVVRDYEYDYIVSGRGAGALGYPPGVTEDEIEEYAYTARNSGWIAQPVARLKPIILDGQKFFDLLGNVAEWNRQGYQYSTSFMGMPAVLMQSEYTSYNTPKPELGFRLARTVK